MTLRVVLCDETHYHHTAHELLALAAIAKFVPHVPTIYISFGQFTGCAPNVPVTSLFRITCVLRPE